MKYPLFLICLISLSVSAQQKKIVLDSANNHGLYICDSIVKGVFFNTASTFAREMEPCGWRFPTIKEQRRIYELTFDNHLLRSSLIPPSFYFAIEDIPKSNSENPVYYVGRMIGREYICGELGSKMEDNRDVFSVFLVKDF